MQPVVIFEDKFILVLEKPSGWITNSASTAKNQPVIQDWVGKRHQSELTNNKEYRGGIVHRLDKETSGILIVARTKEVFTDLQKQFKERTIKKTYLALLHGIVEPGEGEIRVPVGRLPWRRDRFGIIPGGRDSISQYKVSSKYILLRAESNDLRKYSLTEFYPKTGRTHQIRIHSKHIGHPVVSDDFYAGRKTARSDRKWCPRLFLHASEISFIHPANGKKMTFKSGLPSDLEKSMKSLAEV